MTTTHAQEGLRVALFDVDGTLLDSANHLVTTLQAVAKELRLRIPPAEEIIRTASYGWEFQFHIDHLWPDKKVTIQEYGEAYKNLGFDDAPIPRIYGVRRVLNYLRHKNFFLGIISNRDQKSLFRRLAQAEIPAFYFEIIQSIEFEDVCLFKPDPMMLCHPCRRIYQAGYSIEQAIFVGDTISDFETTLETPLKFAGVLSGFAKREDFLEAGATEDCLIESVVELPRLLGMNVNILETAMTAK
jgi:phosphoglycolate phosphatase